jgi:hypothetical protein
VIRRYIRTATIKSLFYCMFVVWITSRFHNGEEIAAHSLQEWVESDYVQFHVAMEVCFLFVPAFRTNIKFQIVRTVASFSGVCFLHVDAHGEGGLR